MKGITSISIILFLITSCSGGSGSSKGNKPVGVNDGLGPEINVIFPIDDHYSADESIKIRASISDPNQILEVSIDGQIAEFSPLADNTWIIDVDLVPGENRLALKANDTYRNETTEQLIVNYDPGSVIYDWTFFDKDNKSFIHADNDNIFRINPLSGISERIDLPILSEPTQLSSTYGYYDYIGYSSSKAGMLFIEKDIVADPDGDLLRYDAQNIRFTASNKPKLGFIDFNSGDKNTIFALDKNHYFGSIQYSSESELFTAMTLDDKDTSVNRPFKTFVSYHIPSNDLTTLNMNGLDIRDYVYDFKSKTLLLLLSDGKIYKKSTGNSELTDFSDQINSNSFNGNPIKKLSLDAKGRRLFIR
ncbi:MAG: hypothetical protein HRU21_11345, partial [Pseudomonadales bacterium]|nr:hypothetical protein [Pseudomonadales bacterium]